MKNVAAIVTLSALFVLPTTAHADDATTRPLAEPAVLGALFVAPTAAPSPTGGDPSSASAVLSPLPAPEHATHGTTLFGLPKNEGPVDRIVRGVIAGTLIGLGSYGLASKNFSTVTSGVLLGVAAIPATTAAVGYCPLYQVAGVDYTF